MNSADFFLLYLHLANHKIINNSTSYPQEVNDCSISPKYSEKLKKANAFFLEQGSTKKAFCLLAFAGLRKTMSVTEWRNPFGRTGFYNQVSSNNNFTQIIGKIKTLTSLKNSITSNLSYPYTAVLSAGQPITAALGSKAAFSLGPSPSPRSVKDHNKPVLDIKLSTLDQKSKAFNLLRKLKRKDTSGDPIPLTLLTNKANFDFSQTLPKGKADDKGASKTNFDFSQSKIERGAKAIGGNQKLQEANLVTRHQLKNKFNAQILSQSFKNNYIAHLKNSDYKSFLGANPLKNSLETITFSDLDAKFASKHINSQKSLDFIGGRKDHRMSLISWASMLNFSGQPVNTDYTGQGCYSNPLIANSLFNSKVKSINQQLEELLSIPPLSPMVHTLPTTRSRLNFSSTVKTKESRQEAEDQEKLFSPDRVKTRAQKIILPRQGFVENALCAFSESLLAKNRSSDDPGFVNTEKNSIKFFFDNAKQNSLLADSGMTRFYTASWLLESIRAELLLRNSNIKRVLNQVFLLTQQPLSSFGKRSALSVPGLKSKSLTEFSALDSLPNSLTENAQSPCFDFSQSGPLMLKTALNNATVIPFLIKGLRVTLSGRMGGRKGMAKMLTKTAGRVPSSTLKEKVDFAKGVVQTKTGSLGIKVWICYN